MLGQFVLCWGKGLRVVGVGVVMGRWWVLRGDFKPSYVTGPLRSISLAVRTDRIAVEKMG